MFFRNQDSNALVLQDGALVHESVGPAALLVYIAVRAVTLVGWGPIRVAPYRESEALLALERKRTRRQDVAAATANQVVVEIDGVVAYHTGNLFPVTIIVDREGHIEVCADEPHEVVPSSRTGCAEVTFRAPAQAENASAVARLNRRVAELESLVNELTARKEDLESELALKVDNAGAADSSGDASRADNPEDVFDKIEGDNEEPDAPLAPERHAGSNPDRFRAMFKEFGPGPFSINALKTRKAFSDFGWNTAAAMLVAISREARKSKGLIERAEDRGVYRLVPERFPSEG